eukprot:TRINITY_DN29797_c0_g1_i1.p1 TRINITY_DN29797_c0_g1~~TRINITY_DN29797_c0_g1_i1.p1  ORF type:complete len:318 (-),score=63.05 TRINITY_DN29797_c0_g1_i1:68-1021(-)
MLAQSMAAEFLPGWFTKLSCCADQQNNTESARSVEQMPVWSNGAHGWQLQERDAQEANVKVAAKPSVGAGGAPAEHQVPTETDTGGAYWQPTAADLGGGAAQIEEVVAHKTTSFGFCCSLCPPTSTPSSPSFMPSSFFIALDRSSGDAVGLAFDVLDEARCIISEVKPQGLVAEWNRTASPSQLVKPGDHIAEINGKPGNGREIASKLMDWASKMRLRLQRPKTFHVKFSKQGKVLGVSLAAHDTSKAAGEAATDVLLITAVNEGGAVAAWNREGSSSDKVGAGDRIIQVNGKTNQTGMLEGLKTSEEVDMIVISWN